MFSYIFILKSNSAAWRHCCCFTLRCVRWILLLVVVRTDNNHPTGWPYNKNKPLWPYCLLKRLWKDLYFENTSHETSDGASLMCNDEVSSVSPCPVRHHAANHMIRRRREPYRHRSGAVRWSFPANDGSDVMFEPGDGLIQLLWEVFGQTTVLIDEESQPQQVRLILEEQPQRGSDSRLFFYSTHVTLVNLHWACVDTDAAAELALMSCCGRKPSEHEPSLRHSWDAENDGGRRHHLQHRHQQEDKDQSPKTDCYSTRPRDSLYQATEKQNQQHALLIIINHQRDFILLNTSKHL